MFILVRDASVKGKINDLIEHGRILILRTSSLQCLNVSVSLFAGRGDVVPGGWSVPLEWRSRGFDGGATGRRGGGAEPSLDVDGVSNIPRQARFISTSEARMHTRVDNRRRRMRVRSGVLDARGAGGGRKGSIGSKIKGIEYPVVGRSKSRRGKAKQGETKKPLLLERRPSKKVRPRHSSPSRRGKEGAPGAKLCASPALPIADPCPLGPQSRGLGSVEESRKPYRTRPPGFISARCPTVGGPYLPIPAGPTIHYLPHLTGCEMSRARGHSMRMFRRSAPRVSVYYGPPFSLPLLKRNASRVFSSTHGKPRPTPRSY
jgi:hypothetical protein